MSETKVEYRKQTTDTIALDIEEARRLHDLLLAQVHLLRQKLGYAQIITRSMARHRDQEKRA